MDQPSVDLHRYALMLARQWRLVLLTAAVGALLALAVTEAMMLARPSYEARALVLITNPLYRIELEPKIKTGQDALNPVQSGVRTQTLVVLARGREVEAAVQQRLGSALPDVLRGPNGLVGAVRVRPNGEVLEVTVQAGDPGLAAELANAWADEVAARIAAIYGADAGINAVEQELSSAREAYQGAEQALLRFTLDNPLDDLARRLKAKEQEVAGLQTERTNYLKARAANIYSTLSELDQVVRDAETLRSQLSEPSRSRAAASGDAVAVMLVRMRSYLPRSGPAEMRLVPSTTENGQALQSQQTAPPQVVTVTSLSQQPLGLQVSNDGMANAGDRGDDRMHDLETMVQALRTRRSELRAELEDVARALQTGPDGAGADDVDAIGAALSQATDDLVRLRAEVTRLQQQKDELTRNRDVLQTSYTALLNKVQELRMTRATNGRDASIVERALPPSAPAQSRARNMAIGALLGLLTGSAIALVRGTSTAVRRSPSITGEPVASPGAPMPVRPASLEQ